MKKSKVSSATSASKSPSSKSPNLDKLPNELIEKILQNAETAKAMRASTKKYEDLVKPKLNNKFWFKEYIKNTFENTNKKFELSTLKLIPTAESKLPTLDVELRKYFTRRGDVLIRINNGNETIFTKISPIEKETKNASWYDDEDIYKKGFFVSQSNKKMFTDVLQNLTKVKVPSTEKTELINTWNKILSVNPKN